MWLNGPPTFKNKIVRSFKRDPRKLSAETQKKIKSEFEYITVKDSCESAFTAVFC